MQRFTHPSHPHVARPPARRALALAALLFALALPASAEADRARHAWVVSATRALEGSPPDAQFEAYRSDYLAALPIESARALPRSQLFARAATARTVLVGDQHDSLEAKQLALDLVHAMRARGPVTLAIEFINPPFQSVLDDHTAGRIDLAALRDRAYKPSSWSFDWRLYAGLLEGARAAGVPVVSVEPGTHLSLTARDAGIARAVKAIPGRVLVFYGSYHLLGRGHLADQLAPELVVTPSAQERYWALASRYGQSFDLLELSPTVVFSNQGSPLVRDAANLRELMDMFGYTSFDEIAHDHPSLPPAPELP